MDADVERGRESEYVDEEGGGAEHDALLHTPNHGEKDERDDELNTAPIITRILRPNFSFLHVLGAFAVGILGCMAGEYLFHCNCTSSASSASSLAAYNILSPGSTESHVYPPTSPTNVFPSLFPTDLGYEGATPTGAEPGLVKTAPAYPMHTGAMGLVAKPGKKEEQNEKEDWDIFQHWGNLSPWYSNKRGTFGLDSGPDRPESCTVTGLHLLHRHGARYPTGWASYGGPATFSKRLSQQSNWTAEGELEFLNTWTYKLGEEILTPFGRQQLFDLGISTRLKYGFLLNNFTQRNTLPVFRTESQNRMFHSAINFALGFFGFPVEGKVEMSVGVEGEGFNHTLAPYYACPNARKHQISDRGKFYVERWTEIYLNATRDRLQSHLKGYDLSIEDVYTMQQLCAYETVAIGYSVFCPLFTREEWEGFDYSMDLYFWYNSAFGSPVGRVQGAGWVREFIARLESKPLWWGDEGDWEMSADRWGSINRTLDENQYTFPVDQSLYVDATHEVVVLNVLTALNLSTLAQSGPLPYTHIPENHSFKVSQLAPFATNVQFQLLDCSPSSTVSNAPSGSQIRIIINDAPVPLHSIQGCPEEKDGMCPLNVFVDAQKALLRAGAGEEGEVGTSWEWGCHGDYADIVGQGEEWETVTGDAPRKKTF
ncbi:phosphoglycerate mutase-like protein [Lentinula raphanica]|nr:phosphoglycerate mutase-like protein [Lentinula raphanica]